MIKTEVHLHTSEVSNCAVFTAAEMIYACSKAGYGAVVVTDHYLPGERESLGARNEFLIGYQNAKQMGKQLGVTILLGMEFRSVRGIEDYLVYGMDEDGCRSLPDDLCHYPLARFYEYCSGQGWLVFQAHPFRRGHLIQDLRFLDGIEVFNGNPSQMSINNNDMAYDFAKQYNLLGVAGSDVHEMSGIGRACMFIPKEMLSPDGIVEYLRALRGSVSCASFVV